MHFKIQNIAFSSRRLSNNYSYYGAAVLAQCVTKRDGHGLISTPNNEEWERKRRKWDMRCFSIFTRMSTAYV